MTIKRIYEIDELLQTINHLLITTPATHTEDIAMLKKQKAELDREIIENCCKKEKQS